MAFLRQLASNGDQNAEHEEATGREQEDDDGIHEVGENRDTKRKQKRWEITSKSAGGQSNGREY